MAKRKIIGYVELFHHGHKIVEQAITKDDEYSKAAVVNRWKIRYGKKLLECTIKTRLLKNDQPVSKINDEHLPDIK